MILLIIAFITLVGLIYHISRKPGYVSEAQREIEFEKNRVQEEIDQQKEEELKRILLEVIKAKTVKYSSSFTLHLKESFRLKRLSTYG